MDLLYMVYSLYRVEGNCICVNFLFYSVKRVHHKGSCVSVDAVFLLFLSVITV